MADAENEFVQWRERLKEAHRLMQDAMSELIDKKDYSAAETSLRVADRLNVLWRYQSSLARREGTSFSITIRERDYVGGVLELGERQMM